ncbi:MAG: S8 family peptidase [Lachnospiraceae bacterium]|nr:S8 family peptidase [Lachnospiraceae bacterium]
MEQTLLSPALREDYSDIIVHRPSFSSAFPDLTAESSLSAAPSLQPRTGIFMSAVSEQSLFRQPINETWAILYAPLSDHLATVEEIGYSSVPKLFTEINVVSLEAAGILPVRIQSFLELSGSGILMGFLDSGIDYTHPAFRNADGTSRILRLWDQSDTRGTPPAGFSYGTEFTKETIDHALFSGTRTSFSENSTIAGYETHPAEADAAADFAPYPDLRGHGTAVAGIACGSPDAGEGFTGAAPMCSIAFVRLKSAKQYLRTYFRIPESAAAYQENDLMLGIRYLMDCAAQLELPLVICVSLGTSQGGHTGHTPFEEILDEALLTPGVCAVTGTGNEVGFDHHYRGVLRHADDSADAELLIDQETQGFSLEFWADSPAQFRLGFTSPLGETISPLWPMNGFSRDFSFLLETSRISVTWGITEQPERAQLILMRFSDPAPGLWHIHVTGSGTAGLFFHLWLPIHGLVDPQIRFLAADADTTLVVPSCAASPVAVGSWNAYNDSLYLHSGRGYTRNNLIKPDLAAPGVQVTCPAAGGSYASITGSCAAAALTAGAAALLFEGGLRQNPPRFFSSEELKNLLLRGVRQRGNLTYPNPGWGNGEMNLYGVFQSFQAHFSSENI